MAKSKKQSDEFMNSVGMPNDGFGEDILKSVNKAFKGTAHDLSLGEAKTITKRFISTGSALLDADITNREDIGGLPVGKMSEVWGKEGCGKTLMAIHAMIDCQKQGGHVMFFDMERRFNHSHAQNLGLDISKERFTYVLPESIDDAFEIMILTSHDILKSKQSGKIDKNKIYLFVYDSISAGQTKAELNKEVGERLVASKSSVIQDGIGKITNMIADEDIAVLFINQVRSVIGASQYQEKESTPGGWYLKFLCSLRIQLKKGRPYIIKATNQTLGYPITYKLRKNSISADNKVGSFDFFFNTGITDRAKAAEAAIDEGVMEKTTGYQYVLHFADGTVSEPFHYTKTEPNEFYKIYKENREYLNSIIKKNRIVDMTNPDLEITASNEENDPFEDEPDYD